MMAKKPTYEELEQRVKGLEKETVNVTDRKLAEEAFNSERDFNSAVLSTIGALVVVLDRDGRITNFNKACEQLTGYSFDEVKGKVFWDLLLIPEEIDSVKAVFLDLRSGQFPNKHENYWVTKDGRLRLISWSNTALMNREDTVEHIIATGIDITERKEAEKALQKAHHELERRVKDRTSELTKVNLELKKEIDERKQAEEAFRESGVGLKKANRALRVLSDCNKILIVATDEIEFIREMSRIIVEEGGFCLAWIGYAEQDEAKTVKPVGHWGYEKGYLDTVNITWADTERGRGPTGKAIRTMKPYIDRNILTNPDFAPWRDEATKRGYASVIVLPLCIDGQCFGVLNIYAIEPDSFDKMEVELLSKLADNLVYGVMTIRMRIEEKKAEEKLKASLKEKEVLLSEIHHRVKNNMQVISSLLKLQAVGSMDERVKNALMESRGRIQAMAAAHETLYASDSLASIDIRSYISKLAKTIFQSYGEGLGRIGLKVEIEEMNLEIEQAANLGLLINELVSNSIKHAFPENREGEIVIRIRSIDQKGIELAVSDNGEGIPEDFDWRNSDTLGLKLISLLAENQFDGVVNLDRDNGTRFNIRLDLKKNTKEYGHGQD